MQSIKLLAAQLSSIKFAQESERKPLCCLVVDSGFSFSHVVPICDGRIIKKGVKRSVVYSSYVFLILRQYSL